MFKQRLVARSIVAVASVTRYVAAKGSNDKMNFLTSKCFELVVFHGIHGEMFIYPHWVGLTAAATIIINKRKVIV